MSAVLQRTVHPYKSRPVGATVEWLTPPEILLALGEFDLDPCCPPVMPWVTAKTMLNPSCDGFSADWSGRVWLNPPYGGETQKWLAKLAAHGNGIAFIFARTETRMFFDSVWGGGARAPVSERQAEVPQAGRHQSQRWLRRPHGVDRLRPGQCHCAAIKRHSRRVREA